MDLQLNDKIALVTESTAGIGLEIARKLAVEGTKVIVTGRNQAKVDQATESNLVAYVASPLSSATNGAALRVDGGVTQ